MSKRRSPVVPPPLSPKWPCKSGRFARLAGSRRRRRRAGLSARRSLLLLVWLSCCPALPPSLLPRHHPRLHHLLDRLDLSNFLLRLGSDCLNFLHSRNSLVYHIFVNFIGFFIAKIPTYVEIFYFLLLLLLFPSSRPSLAGSRPAVSVPASHGEC